MNCKQNRDTSKNRYFPLTLQSCLLSNNIIRLEHNSSKENCNKKPCTVLSNENNQKQQGERKNLFNPPSSLLYIISLVRRIPVGSPNSVTSPHFGAAICSLIEPLSSSITSQVSLTLKS
nr:hypothetical protein Iba_chr10dCG5090 [Ipomoea batatas]GME21761.1 hypothetical protein Iba_scaffold29122CG0010 [Ipomoea batatas]